jgi:hypothetical protein
MRVCVRGRACTPAIFTCLSTCGNGGGIAACGQACENCGCENGGTPHVDRHVKIAGVEIVAPAKVNPVPRTRPVKA